MGRKVNRIIPRQDYSLFMMNIPRLMGRRLRETVMDNLAGMYPGSIEPAAVVIRKNGRKKGSYLIFVLNAFTKENAHPMPASTLLAQYLLAGKSVKAVYIDDSWAEFILLEEGRVVKSLVKCCSPDSLPGLLDAVFGPGTEELALFCGERDRAVLEQHNPRWSFYMLEKISRRTMDAVSLYPRFCPGLRRRRLGVLFLSLALISAGLYGMHQLRESAAREAAGIRREQELRNKDLAEEEQERQYLENLKNTYASLIEHKKTGAYEAAGIIAHCLGTEAQIISITIRENFFQLEAEAPDALKALASFEEDSRIASPLLQNIHHLPWGERFSMSGSLLPEAEILNPGLPRAVQRETLERLIEELQNSNGQSAQSPSAFGSSVRSLLQKWRCAISAYQYLNAGSGQEIEYTIRGESAGFFNFLREGDSRGWSFPLVQIRNLSPRPAVDVVFRAALPDMPETGGSKTRPGKKPASAALPPVSEISRNYSPRRSAAVPAAVPAPESVPARSEEASWLEYLGAVSAHEGNQYIYVKNTKTGDILPLELADAGDLRYRAMESGNIEAYISGKIYEIRRK